MGCDIHLHIEIKLHDRWEHYSACSVARNYALFSKMAGVRGDYEPIAEPRGFPQDASAVTKFAFEDYGADAHTPSWLNAGEIAALTEWYMTEYAEQRWPENDFEFGLLHCYLFGNSFAGFTKYPDEQPKGLQDVRFVFWFDN